MTLRVKGLMGEWDVFEVEDIGKFVTRKNHKTKDISVYKFEGVPAGRSYIKYGINENTDWYKKYSAGFKIVNIINARTTTTTRSWARPFDNL